MIAVVIIGAIVAIIIARYTHAVNLGRVGAAETQVSQIGAALDAYRSDHGSYPSGSGWTSVVPALFGGTSNQYMNVTPTDAAGSGYDYYRPFPEEGGYAICSRTTFNGGDLNHLRVYQDAGVPNPSVMAGPGAYKICYSPASGVFAWW
jgi:type II secretory pathway pseudopilin PulG